MKGIGKILLAFIVSMIAVANAFAFEPSYAKPINIATNAKYTEAFLVNQTYESYMAYSTYRDSGRTFSMPLNSQGSREEAIKYPIAYPDYAVCLDVIQNATGKRIYYGCISSGTIYIHYAQDNKTIVISNTK